MVVLHFHLASPLYAFCIEFRSGLTLLKFPLSLEVEQNSTYFGLRLHSSSSSQPSKNSTRRTLRVNSDISFDNSCMHEFRCVEENFSPFSSYLNSVVFNFLCDNDYLYIRFCICYGFLYGLWPWNKNDSD